MTKEQLNEFIKRLKKVLTDEDIKKIDLDAIMLAQSAEEALKPVQKYAHELEQKFDLRIDKNMGYEQSDINAVVKKEAELQSVVTQSFTQQELPPEKQPGWLQRMAGRAILVKAQQNNELQKQQNSVQIQNTVNRMMLEGKNGPENLPYESLDADNFSQVSNLDAVELEDGGRLEVENQQPEQNIVREENIKRMQAVSAPKPTPDNANSDSSRKNKLLKGLSTAGAIVTAPNKRLLEKVQKLTGKKSNPLEKQVAIWLQPVEMMLKGTGKPLTFAREQLFDGHLKTLAALMAKGNELKLIGDNLKEELGDIHKEFKSDVKKTWSKGTIKEEGPTHKGSLNPSKKVLPASDPNNDFNPSTMQQTLKRVE